MVQRKVRAGGYWGGRWRCQDGVDNPRRMGWAQRTPALTVSECLMHEQDAIEMAWLAAGPRLEIPPNGPGHMLGG